VGQLASALLCWLCTPDAPQAGEFRIASEVYSFTRPEPLIIFTGEVERSDAERLGSIIAEICPADECEYDNNSAILSLNSPGGNFLGGVELAETIRSLKIATVVENDSECYSACALAFLGGSGFHLTGGIGVYRDRYLEPEAKLGFHSPYQTELGSARLSEDQKLELTASSLRYSIAKLVQFLWQYDVDPAVADRIIMMGPDELYEVSTFADLFAFGVTLPEFPVHLIEQTRAERMRNACLRLAALHYRSGMETVDETVEREFVTDISRSETGARFDGYDVLDRPLNVAYCGSIAEEAGSDDQSENFTISLARMGWKEDMSDTFADPIVSLHYASDGWSSAAYVGGTASRSILRLGPLNHWLYPFDRELTHLDVEARRYISDDRRVSSASFERWRNNVLDGLEFATHRPATRNYSYGDISVAVEARPESRFDHTFRRYSGLHTTRITYQRTFENAFVFSGILPAGDSAFYTIGLKDGSASLILSLTFPLDLSTGRPTPENAKLIESIACAAEFGSASLPCKG
jgi:ATP-dependent protease ClpP protease subunit